MVSPSAFSTIIKQCNGVPALCLNPIDHVTEKQDDLIIRIQKGKARRDTYFFGSNKTDYKVCSLILLCFNYLGVESLFKCGRYPDDPVTPFNPVTL